MKNNAIGRAVAACFVLCLSACAHQPGASGDATTASQSAAKSTAQPASHTTRPADITANVPPDVLAVCQLAMAEMSAGRLQKAQRITNECLASHDLPVAMRAGILQLSVFLDIALRDERAALEAQLAAMELTPVSNDMQLVTLAHLYHANHRDDESLATLDRIRVAHESARNLESTVGVGYYQTLGSALTSKKRFSEARAAFDTAIALQPAGAELYRARAAMHEAAGNTAEARADYVQFARWAIDGQLDTPTRAKLASLGIDPTVERRHPFGKANPLRDFTAEQLAKAHEALKSASSAQARAEAYRDISVNSDDLERGDEALTAINKAIGLAPENTRYKQSKVTTLVSINRIDDALALAAPIRKQAHEEAATSSDAGAVYAQYEEVSSSAARAYIQQKKWQQAVDALVDLAQGSDAVDQDYTATTYLYLRAKSAGAAPANAYFDDYIRRAAQPLLGNYRRFLLLYMQGKVPLDQVYAQVVMLGNPRAIQNALAEIWFMGAAHERYIRHDDDAAKAYERRLDDLQAYGTVEWTTARRSGV